ncbi:hypothetical protein ACQYAD_01840 [Neobacillus sp. SM06]|uniref:hypothetical protein n=1 Tax=Neobacillus sp. SM06 TaxID=3422492 RepID=UPI003D2DB28F
MKYPRSVTSYVLAGVGVGSVLWMVTKSGRSSVKDYYQMIKNKFTSSDNKGLPIKKAGHPDPMDIEDNKMVSEGSLYGVQYYNKTKQ